MKIIFDQSAFHGHLGLAQLLKGGRLLQLKEDDRTGEGFRLRYLLVCKRGFPA
jgi:hypothetical protein